MIMVFDATKETEEAFRRLFAEQGIDIIAYEKAGPAGGNPRFTVLADTKRAVMALVGLYFGGEA